MNAKVLLLLAASVALAGCPDKPVDKTVTPAPKVAPAPPPPPASATPPATAEPPTAKADAPARAAAPAKKAPKGATAISCTGTCDVKVKVSKTASGCTIDSVSAEVVNVQPNPAPTIIKWQIDGPPGFKFAQPNGIAFNKPSGAPPGNVMQNGAGGGTAVTVTDKHSGSATMGEWGYTIFVTDGTVKCEKDPWVDNN